MLYKMMDVSNGNSNNFQLTTPQLVRFSFQNICKKTSDHPVDVKGGIGRKWVLGVLWGN